MNGDIVELAEAALQDLQRAIELAGGLLAGFARDWCFKKLARITHLLHRYPELVPTTRTEMALPSCAEPAVMVV